MPLNKDFSSSFLPSLSLWTVISSECCWSLWNMRNSVAKSENFTLTKSVIFSFISSLNKGSFSSLKGKIQQIILSWKMVSCGTCEGDAEDDKVHQDEGKDVGSPEEEFDQPGQVVHIWHFFKLLQMLLFHVHPNNNIILSIVSIQSMKSLYWQVYMQYCSIYLSQKSWAKTALKGYFVCLLVGHHYLQDLPVLPHIALWRPAFNFMPTQYTPTHQLIYLVLPTIENTLKEQS